MVYNPNRNCIVCKRVVRLDRPYAMDMDTGDIMHNKCAKKPKGQANVAPLVVAAGVTGAQEAYKRRGTIKKAMKKTKPRDNAGSYFCQRCGKRHHIKSNIGKAHSVKTLQCEAITYGWEHGGDIKRVYDKIAGKELNMCAICRREYAGAIEEENVVGLVKTLQCEAITYGWEHGGDIKRVYDKIAGKELNMCAICRREYADAIEEENVVGLRNPAYMRRLPPPGYPMPPPVHQRGGEISRVRKISVPTRSNTLYRVCLECNEYYHYEAEKCPECGSTEYTYEEGEWVTPGEAVRRELEEENPTKSQAQSTAKWHRKRGKRARVVKVAEGEYDVFIDGKRKARIKMVKAKKKAKAKAKPKGRKKAPAPTPKAEEPSEEELAQTIAEELKRLAEGLV